jgi:ribosomal protein L11 methyltransferase
VWGVVRIFARYALRPTRHSLRATNKKKEITINQTKYWIEVSVPVTNETEDAITNFLFELGAQGCFNQEDILRAYFSNSDWNEQKKDQFQFYLQQLADLQFPAQPDKIEIKTVEDRDWNLLWKQSVEPIDIGGKIYIKPSWIHIEPPSSKEVIEIDPQMAFGTGCHATTQLILKLLIEHIGTPARIMDMGTGSGILAIAAARLSPAQIIAFDNDPIATTTARQNCIKNQVSGKIHIFCGTIDAVKDIPFDLILANINRSIIFESLSKIYRCLSNTGLAIFSGIFIDEKKQIIENIENNNFKIIKEMQQEEWLGLVVQRGE